MVKRYSSSTPPHPKGISIGSSEHFTDGHATARPCGFAESRYRIAAMNSRRSDKDSLRTGSPGPGRGPSFPVRTDTDNRVRSRLTTGQQSKNHATARPVTECDGGWAQVRRIQKGEWGEVTQTGFRAQLTMVGGAFARAPVSWLLFLAARRAGRRFCGRAHPLRCLLGRLLSIH